HGLEATGRQEKRKARNQYAHQGFLRRNQLATILTILSVTTITLRTVTPSKKGFTAACCSANSRTSASAAPFGASISARFLPFTWIGSVTVLRAAKAGSATGQGAV